MWGFTDGQGEAMKAMNHDRLLQSLLLFNLLTHHAPSPRTTYQIIKPRLPHPPQVYISLLASSFKLNQMAEDVIRDVIVPSYLWLTMAGEALVMQEQSAERVAIIDRPGEGILKVRRWMVGAEEACVDAIGMNADNFQRLCDSLEELGLVRNTAGLPTYLRVALVLYMLRKAATYSTLGDVFQVSAASLSM